MRTVLMNSMRAGNPARPCARPGFSLLEIMISIMILGIGMVMVATVFPVGLDITRETLQMDISQAAVDAAVSTLRVQMPALEPGLDGNILTTQQRVLIPDVYKIELSTPPSQPPPDVSIDNKEAEVLNYPPPGTHPSFAQWTSWSFAPPLTQQTPEEFVDRCRVFTERTAWDAELQNASGHENAYLVPGQNLAVDPAGYGGGSKVITMTVPTFLPASVQRADLARIHLADSVYPPIANAYNYGTTPPSVWDTLEFNNELAGRRYSWTIIHHRVSSNVALKDLLLTVVVTHRPDLNAHYARQQGKTAGPGYNVRFDLGTDTDLLKHPLPDAADTDTMFPQAWLVMLDGIGGGAATCTPDVARLLPAGSFFVIARTQGNLYAGTPHKVLGTTWEPASSLTSFSLTVAKGTPGGSNVLVWVFPPPILSHGTPPTFGSRAPIAGVTIRGLAP